MGASYTREKLDAAVYALATGTDTIQERLVAAFIAMSVLSNRDFDNEERLEEWMSIHRRATANKSGPEEHGHYRNTLSALNDDEAQQLAKDICELEAMMDLDAG